ncbi:MAG: hypothetical protein ACREON_00400 [Gemmatimonadaceae bacterium]
MLVLVGKDGPFIVGVQSPSLVARARKLLSSLRATRAMYALIISGDSALERGDGGWGKAGAVTIAHERIRIMMRFAPANAPMVGDLPVIGFSEVFQLATNDDEIHAVHQPAGFSDADVSVHFEERQFVYLGNLFTNDGYPVIDVTRGGSIAGLIQASEKFLEMFGGDPKLIEPIVPGRGALATISDLRAYRDMLVAVRNRIEPLLRSGRTVEDVVAFKPTAAFDARWGRGLVTADRFVAMVYSSLSSALKPEGAPR